nr:MAG TPA: hypothetical protein [Caudoviricetes sp.]
MQKRYFTVEDLIKFCEQDKMYNFSSKESGKPIVIQAIQDFSSADIEETEDNKLFAKVRVCHTLLNRNGSYISEESMKAAMPSLKYAPLLANIHQLDDGSWDFHSHDYHIEKDEDGNEVVVYDEKQVGTFTADDPYLEYDEEMDKTYVIARVAIPESYTRCADIIREKNGTKVSCELIVYDCSYNAKEKYLQLENFEFAGCTCLGSEKDGTPIGEGMLGSKITLEAFSEENNSLIKFNEKMVELQARLEKLETACFDNNNSEEGGNENLNKFDELCQKYGKTVEDITFDYKNMSDDELEAKFAELFDDNSNGDNSDNGESSELSNDGKGNDEGDFSLNNNEGENQNSEKLVRTYEISHEDIKYALYSLLAPYEESDGDYYYIFNVYDSNFEYEGYYTDKIYRQGYTKNDDNITFEGERIELFRELLTASEKAELDAMRSNYAALKDYKETAEKNELHSKKEAILADEKYSVLSENEAFTELKNNMDNYSIDDLETKAKVIFADYVSSVGAFSAKPETQKSKVLYMSNSNSERESKKKTPYGGIFEKYNK